MSHLYILDGHEPVPCDDVLVWGRWLETANRVVAKDDLADGAVHVSTVFLGIDHNYGDRGPAILFETMVWFDGNDVSQERYATWAAAEAGHRAVVASWRARLAR